MVDAKVNFKAVYRRTVDGESFCKMYQQNTDQNADLYKSALCSLLQFCFDGANMDVLRKRTVAWITYTKDLLSYPGLVMTAEKKQKRESELGVETFLLANILTLLADALTKGYLALQP